MAGTGGEAAAAPRSPGSEGAPVADEATVRALLRSQLPGLADRPLVPGPTGWDNTHWLLGGDLAVRLPRRPSAVPLLANEVRALTLLGDELPVTVPVPVHVGDPVPDGRAGWPWPWTVVPWFDAERADLAYPPAPAVEHGAALGRFLAALHRPAPPGTPHNPYRGVPLEQRVDRFEQARAAVVATGRLSVDLLAAVDAAWRDALAAPAHAGPSLWLHGDLHPGNQLVRDRALFAVVDWGDTTGGDPATDLATAWWTLPPEGRSALRDGYGGVDDATWARARGWAVALAVQLLADGPATGDHALVAVALRTCQRLRGQG